MGRKNSTNRQRSPNPEKLYINKLFEEYARTKDVAIRNELIERFLYIPEILSKICK